jgi:hypothetical protein
VRFTFRERRRSAALKPRVWISVATPTSRLQQVLLASCEAYKLNELILAEMKRKIEGNIGRDRFAVLLLPTKWGFPGNLPFSEGVHDAVAKEVLASLTRLRIPAIDGREVLTQGNFWKHDEHWNASGHKKIGEQLGNFLNRLID